MKKTLLCWIFLLVFLTIMSFGAFAETTDAPADETILLADLARFKETGELFDGVIPGASLQQTLDAGIPLPTDTWYLSNLHEESVGYHTEEGCVVMIGELRFDEVTFLRFLNDRLYLISLTSSEGYLLEDVRALVSGVLGEPTEELTSDHEYMHWTYEMRTETYIDLIWEIDLGDEKVSLHISSIDKNDGTPVKLGSFAFSYDNYVPNLDEEE